MSSSCDFSHFSIEMTASGFYYVAVGKTAISHLFKDKEVCRKFCSAIERSFSRLHNRYMLEDYHSYLNPVETASGVGVDGA